MSKTAGRELKRLPASGYICTGCGEVWTLVVVDHSYDGPMPQDVGCPNCWADLEPALIWNVGGRSYVGRAHRGLLGKGADDPASDAVT